MSVCGQLVSPGNWRQEQDGQYESLGCDLYQIRVQAPSARRFPPLRPRFYGRNIDDLFSFVHASQDNEFFTAVTAD
jgi:hypothetical protein